MIEVVLCRVFFSQTEFPKPMAFTLYKYLYTGGYAVQEDMSLDFLWQQASLRSTFRLVTGVVGIALVALMVLRIFLVFSLSISLFLGIAPLIFLSSDTLLGLWVFRSMKVALQRERAKFTSLPPKTM